MSGIVFFRTSDRERCVEFYRDSVGAEVWLDQGDCTVLAHGEFKFGFCQRAATDACGIVTFYYDDRAAVDERYDALETVALSAPEVNEDYDIYHFFADDPDGRTVEFQTFLHALPGEE